MAIDMTTYMLARGYVDGKIASSDGKQQDVEITIEAITGQIPAEDLEKLFATNNSVVILDGKYYRLARIEGDNYKYINSTTNSAGQTCNMTELDINKNTGEFETKQIVFQGSSVQYLEDELQAHINDNSVHITATERNYWNNKVSAEAESISGEQDYKLKLKH